MKTNSRARTKNLYIKPEYVEIWSLAARYVPFFEKQSLSEFLTDHLQKYVEEKRKLVKGE